MGALILISLITAVTIVAVVAELRDRRRVNPNDPRTQNHQQLVRWVDNILADEMVAPLISESQKDRGAALVSAYYNERA